jgi:pre-mRNA-splicing factor CWC22
MYSNLSITLDKFSNFLIYVISRRRGITGSFIWLARGGAVMSEKRNYESALGVENEEAPLTKRVKRDDKTTKAGGVYVPPHRLRQMAAQNLDKSSKEYQRMTWDALRKSINGLINKVNVSNLSNIVPELFQENLVRGRGLLCRSLVKAQTASPKFTQVYAALVAVVNAKMPNIGELLVSRLVIQFRKAFQRNDKITLLASTRFLAHLLNQQVAGEIVALQILSLLLERPTDDSVEVACEFTTECGYVLQSLSPEGFNGVFERFRAILHEGTISKRVQYIIEHVFAVRKSQFAEFPGVIEQLDLIDADDQITHEDVTLDAELEAEEGLNFFHEDSQFLAHEERYQAMKKAILADLSDYEEDEDGGSEESGEENESDNETAAGGAGRVVNTTQKVEDMTESVVLALRRQIYLVIMSSLDFEECAHKVMRMNIEPGQELEVANMIIECCLQARTFLRFAALLAQRLCMIERLYQDLFHQCFVEQFSKVYRLETNALRNLGKFFAHLLHSHALHWSVLQHIRLNEEDTNASSRIFVKILFQELVEYLGLAKLNELLLDPLLASHLTGVFPRDSPKDTRFAINFFTSIGLGGLTDGLRQHLSALPKRAMLQAAMESSSSDDSSSSSEESSSSDDSSDSSNTRTFSAHPPILSFWKRTEALLTLSASP